jgi:tetratricopeptide (TPR) repeat protein
MALWGAQARAQSKEALAEALFNDGKRLIESGQVSAACVKFAESQRLDPASGTLFNLAECHEKEGKLASAWAEYLEAVSVYNKANKTEKANLCRDRAAALEPKLSRLTISMADRPKGLTISLDGKSVGDGILGTAVPMDPGKHSIAAAAPGKKTWEQEVKVEGNASSSKVEIPALQDDPTGGAAAAGAGTSSGTGAPKERVIEVAPDTTKRTVGFIVGGTGIALGITAAVLQFGVALPTNDKRKQAEAALGGATSSDPSGIIIYEECPAPTGCTRAEVENSVESRRTAAKNTQLAAIGLAAGGVVALGVGIVLIVTSGGSRTVEKTAKHEGPRVMPVIGPNQFGLAGTF